MSDTPWLKNEMKYRGLSQREIADILGLHPSGVSRILGGNRELTPDEVTRLRSFFGEPSTEDLAELQDIGPLHHALNMSDIEPEELAARSSIPLDRLHASLSSGGTLEAADAKIAAMVLGVSAGWLAGKEQRDQIRRLRVRRPRRPNDVLEGRTARAPMPIYAPPMLRDGLLFCDFEIAERRPAPPELQQVTHAYGLFVGDGDYGPRFRTGDIVYVHPSKPVHAGDPVIAVLMPRVQVGELEIGPDGRRSIKTSAGPVEIVPHAELHRIVGVWLG